MVIGIGVGIGIGMGIGIGIGIGMGIGSFGQAEKRITEYILLSILYSISVIDY